MAQLQMGNFKILHDSCFVPSHFIIFLLNPWIHCQKNSGRVNYSQNARRMLINRAITCTISFIQRKLIILTKYEKIKLKYILLFENFNYGAKITATKIYSSAMLVLPTSRHRLSLIIYNFVTQNIKLQ